MLDFDNLGDTERSTWEIACRTRRKTIGNIDISDLRNFEDVAAWRP